MLGGHLDESLLITTDAMEVNRRRRKLSQSLKVGAMARGVRRNRNAFSEGFQGHHFSHSVEVTGPSEIPRRVTSDRGRAPLMESFFDRLLPFWRP